MKCSTLLAAIILLASHVGAAQSRKAHLPHVPDGYSLFSWRVGNDRYFSLIDETSGPKSFDEATSPKVRVKGIAALKRKLSALPRNEEVIWVTERLPGLSLPPENMLRQINAHSRRTGIKLIRVIT
jgi:hypothetical protein